MAKQKVLVTGGTGFIGSHTVVELIQKGYEVVIFDNLCNSDMKVVSKIEKITGIKPEFVNGDIRNSKKLDDVFVKHKFDSVIHFAGLKAVGESVSKPILYYENNLAGTICLMQAMLKHGVNRIVFSSSATVYGDQETPYREDMRKLPAMNPYGATKSMVEDILTDIAAANKNFTAILLRYFNPVGAHDSGLIGESPCGIPNNLAPYIMQVAGGEREYLGVYGNDYETSDGTGVRDYIHVVDLALGHVAALEKCNGCGAFIYNLGTGKGTSVLEILAAFEKAVGKKIPYKIQPRRAGDLAAYWADCEKAKKELGWCASLGLNEMCGSAWKFYLENSK